MLLYVVDDLSLGRIIGEYLDLRRRRDTGAVSLSQSDDAACLAAVGPSAHRDLAWCLGLLHPVDSVLALCLRPSLPTCGNPAAGGYDAGEDGPVLVLAAYDPDTAAGDPAHPPRGRGQFPDLILHHPFGEAVLDDPWLFATLETAGRHLPPHRLAALAVPSAEALRRDMVLVDGHGMALRDLDVPRRTQDAADLAGQLAAELRLSATRRHRLRLALEAYGAAHGQLPSLEALRSTRTSGTGADGPSGRARRFDRLIEILGSGAGFDRAGPAIAGPEIEAQ